MQLRGRDDIEMMCACSRAGTGGEKSPDPRALQWVRGHISHANYTLRFIGPPTSIFSGASLVKGEAGVAGRLVSPKSPRRLQRKAPQFIAWTLVMSASPRRLSRKAPQFIAWTLVMSASVTKDILCMLSIVQYGSRYSEGSIERRNGGTFAYWYRVVGARPRGIS